MKKNKKYKTDKILLYIKEKYANRKDKDNIFGVGMTDSEFVEGIIYELLGDEWYVVDPLGHDQINECAFEAIMLKYKRKYYEKALKEMRVCIRIYFKTTKDPKTSNGYKDIICNRYVCDYEPDYGEMICKICGGEYDGHIFYDVKGIERIW